MPSAEPVLLSDASILLVHSYATAGGEGRYVDFAVMCTTLRKMLVHGRIVLRKFT